MADKIKLSVDGGYAEYEPEPIGYMPFNHINAEARQIAHPDGSFVVELWQQNAEDPEPYIRVAMSKAGKQVVMLAEKGQHVFKTADRGIAHYSLVVAGPKTRLAVGTYEIEALVDNHWTVKKFVSIPDSPFATGGNSEYVESIARAPGSWVLKGEYPITGGETGVEIRFYKPMFRSPNWISAALYDENHDPVAGTEVRITDKNAERFQIEFVPPIPADKNWTLVYAAWV